MSYREVSGVLRVTGGLYVLLAMVVFCILLFVLRAGPAYAGQARLFTGSFGGPGSTPANPYPLSRSRPDFFSDEVVAVDDATHDVYVTDPDNNRVEKFGPAGEFILMFGKEVNLTMVLSAASEAEQDVCTVASFDTCQAGTSTGSPGGFSSLTSIAVDNSSGESKGDVYVADGAAAVVSKFDSAGNLVSGWASKGQLNGSNATGAVKGPFARLFGLAVDTSGNLWVSGAGSQFAAPMFEFRPDSTFITGWTYNYSEGESVPGIVAVDSKDNLYLGSRVTRFDSVGNEIGIVQMPSTAYNQMGPTGLAVDPTHDELYVDTAITSFDGLTVKDTNVIQRFDSSCRPSPGVNGARCTPVESFGSDHLIEPNGSFGMAIDPAASGDTLYVAELGPASDEVAVFSVETVPDAGTLKATDFASTSATLNGSVNPSGVELKAGLEGCRFEWGETEAYGNVAPCDQSAAQIGSGSSPVEVSASISGLQQGRTYHFRLVAGNANDVNSLIDEPSTGKDLAFGPPVIESASAIAVAANGATVQAEVNPNNVDTRVRVEYGSEAGVYGHSTREAALGADGTGLLASFQLSGLVPGTVYHYRVVAENALGEGAQAILGADRVFVTQSAVTGSVLVDGRGWELVSPPDKHGSRLSSPGSEEVIQASVSGDAVSYLTLIPTEAEPAGHANGVQVLSRRKGSGWVSRDLSLPHEQPVGVKVGTGEEYRMFSSDLSLAVVQPFGPFDQEVSSEASEQTAFLRTDFPSGQVDSPCVASCYRPLVTGAPGYENVPSETVFGPECETKEKLSPCGPRFDGASPDLSHVVLGAAAALTEGAPTGKVTGGRPPEVELYEWSGGDLVLVSVLPGPGGQPALVSSDPVLGEQDVVRNTVSDDGSRIVWSTGVPGKEHLYVRDTVKEETVQVGSGGVRFQAASRDGSKIFFTEEGGEGVNRGDLQECDIVEGEGELRCEMTDLSPVGAGENPGVLGVIPGASDDGSYVYFVANGVLENNGVAVPGAQPGGCSNSPSSAVCNLYARHNGTVRLVAVLSQNDIPDWSDLSGMPARVSSDGRWLEFMSGRSLTGYDNRDSVTGRPDMEVYLYDASATGGEGRVVCASCNPTGARPHGNEFKVGNISAGSVNFGQGVAANTTGWVTYDRSHSLYPGRYLFDGGRLFFNSSDALVPQDSNGTGDVYEYEPPGVGDCTISSVTFSATSGGCVGLVSSGISNGESGFMDASGNGNDVFFLSFAQLSHRDTDGIADVYDARVDGGFPEAPPPPVCEGDACQSPVSAPEDPTPGSLTYNGPGNPGSVSFAVAGGESKAKGSLRARKLARALNACKRDRSKRARGKCVARARKRYGRVGARNATMKGGKR